MVFEVIESRAGPSTTRWAEYEVPVDWISQLHIRCVHRVYASYLIELGGEDITSFTRVLEVDGLSEDASRKITMASGALSSLSGLDGSRYASRIHDGFRRIKLLGSSGAAATNA